MKGMTMAYLEITLQLHAANRAAAAAVYQQYKQPFLDAVPGATSKELLVRDEDVQVLHGFATAADAKAYLRPTWPASCSLATWSADCLRC
jgi:hypothetical protein